jgi:hypothetical protein
MNEPVESLKLDHAVTLKLHQRELEIDGVRVSYEVLPQLILAIVHPDPRRWLRFERVGNIVNVHVRLQKEEPNGTSTGAIGRDGESGSAEGAWGQGREAAHPRDAYSANEE